MGESPCIYYGYLFIFFDGEIEVGSIEGGRVVIIVRHFDSHLSNRRSSTDGLIRADSERVSRSYLSIQAT